MLAIYVKLSDIVIKLAKVLLERDMIITLHEQGEEKKASVI